MMFMLRMEKKKTLWGGWWTMVLQCSCAAWSRSPFAWTVDHGTIVLKFRIESVSLFVDHGMVVFMFKME